MDQENRLEQGAAKEEIPEAAKVVEETPRTPEAGVSQESPQGPDQDAPKQEENKVEEKAEVEQELPAITEEAPRPEKKAVEPANKRVVGKKKSASKKAETETLGKAAGLSNSQQWYVVHTLSGQENKVKEVMESQLQSEDMGDMISEVLIPTENVSEVKGGKKTVTTRKFFPGYVLVHMMLNDETWYFVRNCTGVIGFIGTGNPVPLQPHEVDEIISQIEEKKEKVKPKVMFDVGENVKVNDGPFVNFTGSVEEVNPDRGKLKVVVSIFGRATPIELEYWQVERA